MGKFGNPDFDLFQLPEEHQALREAIRALAEKEIAPHAKDVDENARFPEEARTALIANGFNAVHVPEQFDGQGADSVAACIVIEEVARHYGYARIGKTVPRSTVHGGLTVHQHRRRLLRQVLQSVMPFHITAMQLRILRNL